MKIILTGATGFVGEGVLLECLANPNVEAVLLVARKHYSGTPHPKIRECMVPSFFDLKEVEEQLSGYDACFYCAGKSSVGMGEQDYRRLTLDMAVAFAATLLALNPAMVFCHISGAGTDSSGSGRAMWARVKGQAENALSAMPFKAVYHFRPGVMKPSVGQRNLRGYNRFGRLMYPLMSLIFPHLACTLREVGAAMVNSVLKGAPKQTLEVDDIKVLAG
jgi:uncharacterized protein YbjT (DUF2867 family)